MKIAREFLPLELADSLLHAYETTNDWETENQSSPYAQIKQLFSEKSLPSAEETYFASFENSPSLQNHQIVSRLKEEVDAKISRCYRMKTGHGFRIHTDNYFERSKSHVLYLNKIWKWDWGGILNVISDDGLRCVATLPEFNTLVTIDYSTCRAPHFVSPITNWAPKPRYVLVMF